MMPKHQTEEDRGLGDPIYGCPALIKEENQFPHPGSSLQAWGKFKSEAKEKLGGLAALLAAQKAVIPVARPPLSLFANRVFLTCHLLLLCRSADKGPCKITESISDARVRQRLLSVSLGASSSAQQPLPTDTQRWRNAGWIEDLHQRSPASLLQDLKRLFILFIFGIAKDNPYPWFLRK